jgi:hypothetical protein
MDSSQNNPEPEIKEEIRGREDRYREPFSSRHIQL